MLLVIAQSLFVGILVIVPIVNPYQSRTAAQPVDVDGYRN